MLDTDTRRLGVPCPLRLTTEQIERIHEASLETMVQTGMRFYDQEALGLFKKTGASGSGPTRRCVRSLRIIVLNHYPIK